MDEATFREKYEREKILFYSWGKYVQTKILEVLKKEVEDVVLFLKIPPGDPRVKEVNSLISKAYRRGKNYTEPYSDITDKVGMRFVVLLTEEIKIIENIIEKNPEWTFSKDRDFEEETKKRPEYFTYQSNHYIVKNKFAVTYNGVTIAPDTPCEIQIRTLLQHAYSELTHDTTYKRNVKIEPKVSRYIARSMALIESTDDLFVQVNNLLLQQDKLYNFWIAKANEIYYNIPGAQTADYNNDLNIFILDELNCLLENKAIEDVMDFINGKITLWQDIISRKYPTSLLYKQPVILFIYYFICTRKNRLRELWPLPPEQLCAFFIDLGISFD